MATTDIRQKTHQRVLPQLTALESTSADTRGVRTKRGVDVLAAERSGTSGISHGRGETARQRHRSAQRHGGMASAEPSATGGSDPIPTTEQPQESTDISFGKVFVLDKRGEPLMPCHPARARQLLAKSRARVAKAYPFTIRLIDREVADSEVDGVQVKIDPGSKYTGIAVTRTDQNETVHGLASIELRHRGAQISRNLTVRSAYRRGRRTRNLRHRAPRYLNRTRPKGWLAPSLQHRVNNIASWVERLRKLTPVTAISMELVRFDTQLMENPEISGVEYQQGTLAEYELREYLLEKYRRTCVYCDATNCPLNLDHLVPRARGGSDRAANRVLACVSCNQAKAALPVEQFVTDPKRLAKILAGVKKPLRDAAAVNSTRRALFRQLAAFGLPISTGTGGLTKWNRHRFDLPKSHTLDALAVGEINRVGKTSRDVLVVASTGRGTYQRTLPDKYGFPRLHRSRIKQHHGFQTGDLVKAVVPRGKYRGTHVGRVAIRERGAFVVTTAHGKAETSHKNCQLLQRADGYTYQPRKEETA